MLRIFIKTVVQKQIENSSHLIFAIYIFCLQIRFLLDVFKKLILILFSDIIACMDFHEMANSEQTWKMCSVFLGS